MEKQLLKRVLMALWETQWTSRWAAENTVCAYNCRHPPYQDQELHRSDCDFVQLWEELRVQRKEAGVIEDFNSLQPLKRRKV